jgi:uncharacterized protein (TIRG00374 family)
VRVRWTGVLGIGITLLLLWWVLRGVRLADVWAEIRGAHWGWLLASIAAATATFPLRTVRWRVLLRHEGAPVPFKPLWHATAIGFMSVNFLSRAGEVARAFAAARLTGTRFTTAAASIAVERVFDGLVIVALLLLGLGAGGLAGTATIEGVPVARLAVGAGALFSVAFVMALLVVIWPAWWLRLAERMMTRVLPARWAEGGTSLLEGVIAGLTAIRAPGRAATILGWTMILWLVNGASFALAFQAFGLDVPAGAALVTLGVVALGVAIPSSPGFVGVLEAAVVAALALYGVSQTVSFSVAVAYHVGGFVPITVLGLWSLGRANLKLADLLPRGRTA